MDWTTVINWLSEHGWRILIIIALSLALYYLLHHFVPVMIINTLSHTMKKKPKTAVQKRTDTLSAVFIKTGVVVIIIVAVFTILAEVGISIAPALVGLGIAGIAIGFGAQSLVKDIFNGLLILLEDQYGVGDVVQIAGISGGVEEVSLRRTVLRDLDGIAHSIPNSQITVASNYTKDWARINMNISVGYGEDLDNVFEVINRVCKELAEDAKWAPVIITTPKVLRVDALGDSGVDIKILGETKEMQQWAVMGELRLRIKKTFDDEGIEIPWPHVKLYLGDVSAKKLLTKLANEQSMSNISTSSDDKPKE